MNDEILSVDAQQHGLCATRLRGFSDRNGSTPSDTLPLMYSSSSAISNLGRDAEVVDVGSRICHRANQHRRAMNYTIQYPSAL